MAAQPAKQARTLSYSKCHFCRRDKKKCEPKDRIWPEQKCNRCLLKNLECSASVSLSQQSNPSSQAPPQDERGTHLSSLALFGEPLPMASMAPSEGQDTQHAEPTPVPFDGPRSAISRQTKYGSLPPVTDHDAGTIVQIRAAEVGHRTYRSLEHLDGEWDTFDYHVIMQGGPDSSSRQSLKRAHSQSGEEGPHEGNHGGPTKRYPSDLSRGKLFACPFNKVDPIRHRACLTLKLFSCSRVKQHLSTAHTPTYYCQRCLIILPDKQEYEKHVKEKINGNCVSKNDSECDFVNHEQSRELLRKSPRLSEEEKWYQLWNILFPTKQRPASPFIDPALSEELVHFNEFLQNQGVIIMASMCALESALPISQESGIRLQEFFHQGFSSIWQNWILDRQSPQHGLVTERDGRVGGASLSAVTLPESRPTAESSSADIIEAGPEDDFMRQLVIFETKDGRDYVFEQGQLSTDDYAEFCIVGKRLVAELGLKTMPLLGLVELLRNQRPICQPVGFVSMKFRLPMLNLDWVMINAYVIDDNVGFSLGARAMAKFDLLSKLLSMSTESWVQK